MRVFKTSSSETESGIIDIVYAQDGLGFDDNHQIGSTLSRPKADRQRHYLAQTETGNCRGRAGFVVQGNYRPFDDVDFEMTEPGNAAVLDNALFQAGGDVSALWFVMDNGGGTKAIFPASRYSTSFVTSNIIGIVIDAL